MRKAAARLTYEQVLECPWSFVDAVEAHVGREEAVLLDVRVGRGLLSVICCDHPRVPPCERKRAAGHGLPGVGCMGCVRGCPYPPGMMAQE